MCSTTRGEQISFNHEPEQKWKFCKILSVRMRLLMFIHHQNYFSHGGIEDGFAKRDARPKRCIIYICIVFLAAPLKTD